MTRNRLPMISTVLAILAVACAWGATFASRPWDIVLVIIALVAVATTTGTIGYWVTRARMDNIDR